MHEIEDVEEPAATDDIGDVDQDTDATAKPAEPVAEPAKRILGADWEPGPDSPLNEDGSPRWSAVDAYGRWAAQVIPDELAGAAKRREAACAVWWGKDGDGQ